MIELNEFEQALLHPVIHTVADWLRRVGLRDRYRCPECHAVGTFKPHGGKFDTEDERHVPRWLCKWCGYYIGPEGRMWCVIDSALHVWREPEAVLDGWTPARVMGKVNPWNG